MPTTPLSSEISKLLIALQNVSDRDQLFELLRVFIGLLLREKGFVDIILRDCFLSALLSDGIRKDDDISTPPPTTRSLMKGKEPLLTSPSSPVPCTQPLPFQANSSLAHCAQALPSQANSPLFHHTQAPPSQANSLLEHCTQAAPSQANSLPSNNCQVKCGANHFLQKLAATIKLHQDSPKDLNLIADLDPSEHFQEILNSQPALPVVQISRLSNSVEQLNGLGELALILSNIHLYRLASIYVDFCRGQIADNPSWRCLTRIGITRKLRSALCVQAAACHQPLNYSAVKANLERGASLYCLASFLGLLVL
ncbi:hypothetical protein K493DRAFT_309266 [Basidiobolus meristosporus CBS 931.73]|uniref:Uncharacterized protein n=1 Tax=Basidiobolus meristosporus CBS 931.73 TaxID=1314790 RepID=A0A1Y1WG61_9FUNG|nr:hypothetical protein K493DRAFT_309266 [Basidiobolus meristosporus CBS 931.73]|eukprot:ORX72530.1 hypothetical protein K493DRAFT_309266 [Basidiobolus meristosporus CBS 931.73]